MTLLSFGDPKNDNLCRRRWQIDGTKDTHAPHNAHTHTVVDTFCAVYNLGVRCTFFVASSHSISSNSSLPKAYLLKMCSAHCAAAAAPPPPPLEGRSIASTGPHRIALQTQDNLLTTGSIYWSAIMHTQAILRSAKQGSTTMPTTRRWRQ